MYKQSAASLSVLLTTPRRRKTPQNSPGPSTPPSPSPLDSSARLSRELSCGLDSCSASPATEAHPVAQEVPWPRLQSRVSEEELCQAAEKVFGYAPRPWQISAATKILEGRDVMVAAGTGAGKSMVFGLLAIAIGLTGGKGLVVVVCPLKALQADQVRRFNEFRTGPSHAGQEGVAVEGGVDGAEKGDDTEADARARRLERLRIRAVAVNEDNNESRVFKSLAKGKTHLCYASPECLLRNDRFKQLFRTDDFRKLLVALVVDEAHVIAQWADQFRRDYGELSQLRIITGTEIPWGLVSATLPSQVFNLCFKSVRVGENRPFWGLDLGTDRPNLVQLVRRMGYAYSSFAALLPFIPEVTPTKLEDLPKTIFYFRTRRDTRTACDLLRRLLPQALQDGLWPYTAVFTEHYKTTVMEWFRTGTARWLFCTDAAGMGCDIPDIVDSVIYGIQELCAAFQKGGRAARCADLQGRMIWLVEDWVFDDAPGLEGPSGTSLTTSTHPLPSLASALLSRRREKLDPAARTYVNRTQGESCMRDYAIQYFRPQPEFVPETRSIDYDRGDRIEVKEGRVWPAVWTVERAGEKPTPGCCCSARCCRADADTPVGELTAADRKRISLLQHKLRVSSASLTPSSSSRPCSPTVKMEEVEITLSPTRRCSQAERTSLNDLLLAWRDERYPRKAKANPMLTRQWIISDTNISTLVSKAHKIVNARDEEFDSAFVQALISWMTDDETLDALVSVLRDFRTAFRERHKQRKRVPRNDEGDGSPRPKNRKPAAEALMPNAFQVHEFQLAINSGENTVVGPSETFSGMFQLEMEE